MMAVVSSRLKPEDEVAAVHPNHGYRPKPKMVSEVKVDDLVVIDAFYGVERVLMARVHDSSTGNKICHMQLAYTLPAGDGERTRFVEKGASEPVTTWVPLSTPFSKETERLTYVKDEEITDVIAELDREDEAWRDTLQRFAETIIERVKKEYT